MGKAVDSLKNAGRTKSLKHILLLALPFLAVLIYTKGLTTVLPVAKYLTYDESKFHYPTVLQFAKEFPFVNLVEYSSATTPLYHLFLSAWSRVFEGEIGVLRLVTTFISFFAVVVLYTILVRRLRLSPVLALLLTYIFLLSPYFLGASFVIQPGNAAVLLCLLSLNKYLRFRDDGKDSDLLWSLIFIMLCILCRQTYLYVLIALSVDLILRIKVPARLIRYFVWIGLSLLPYWALIFLWKGLTPPGFSTIHTASDFINISAAEFGFVALGAYSAFMLPSVYYKSLTTKEVFVCGSLVLASVVLLILKPLNAPDNLLSGNLPRIASNLPSISKNSILYYLLLPAGMVACYLLVIREKSHFFILLLFAFFLCSLPSKIVFQRYYDIAILLILILINSGNNIQSKRDVILKCILLASFISYYFIYGLVDP